MFHKLENNDLTVFKILENDTFDLIVLDTIITKGSYLFEVNTENMDLNDEFLVGVVNQGIPFDRSPLETGMFYGIQPFQFFYKRK